MGLRLKHKQKGFIVEALLLVMGAGLMAIPSYNAYKDRVKAREGQILASSAKVAMNEYYVSHNNQLPQGSPQEIHQQLGLVEPQMISADNVESITVGSDGRIRAQYRPEVFNNSALVFEFTPNEENGYFSWTCRAQSEDKRFLRSVPPECRN